jgi:O-antigen/teichoic acid export membrane protein
MTPGSLRSLAERAFKWSALTTIGRFLLQLVAQITLARLLGPSNYGVYGIGLVVLTFATFISGNSFSYILMLQKDVGEEDVRFAFTWQVIAGITCAVAMYFGAGPLASFFGDARVHEMVQWLALACILMALAGPSTCLLQRDLNFQALGLIQLGSYALGYLVVGVPMALQGYGAQALAMACVVQAAVMLVAGFAVRPHSVRPMFAHPAGALQTLDTGRTVFLTNLINWLLANLDRIVIGRVLTAHAVGLFNVAYNIASIPYHLLASSIQPTLLATGARLQDDRAQLGQAWLTVLACIAVLVVPASVVMALLAPDLVQVLYGSAWSEAGWVMAVMFLCVPAWAFMGLSTPVLWNTGRKHLEVWLQLPVLAVAIPAWWWLAPSGIRVVALVSAAVVYARSVAIMAASMRAVQLPLATLLPLLWRGFGLAVLCTAAVTAGRHAGLASFDHPAASLLCGGTAALLAVFVLVAARPQVLGVEARAVLSRVIPAMRPAWPAATPEVRP